MNLLFVANKKLPPSDYRVRYGLTTRACDVYFGLPERPDVVPESHYVLVDAGEGLRVATICSLVRLWSLLRRGTMDCVHFSATALILLGPYVCAAAGTPCLITLTGFGRTFTSKRFVYKLLRPIYWLLLSGAIRIAERVLLQNTGDLLEMRRRYPRHAARFILIGSGVEAPVRAVRRCHDDAIRVVLVARLLPDKGITDFLKVAAQRRTSQFHFVLVGPAAHGGGDMLKSVKHAAAVGDIEYLGELNETELQRIYERSHVLLFPSVGEGMPRVMLEAGFAGLCPIAYDIPATRDLIQPGGGILVQSGDADGLLDALDRLAADRLLIQTEAAAYQRHVVTAYGMDTFTRRMDAVVSVLKQQHIDGQGTQTNPAVGDRTCGVRLAEQRDIKAIAAVHAAAFPGFFLTRMGTRFLAAYYQMVLHSPEGVVLVMEDKVQITGFAAGFSASRRFYGHAYRSLLRLSAWALIRLATRPSMLVEVIARAIRVAVSGHPQGVDITNRDHAELSSLAVLPSQQRLGHGRQLVVAFLDTVRQRGAASVRVTTDMSGNEGPHAFYTSLGFARSSHSLHAGRRALTEYTINTGSLGRAA